MQAEQTVERGKEQYVNGEEEQNKKRKKNVKNKKRPKWAQEEQLSRQLSAHLSLALATSARQTCCPQPSMHGARSNWQWSCSTLHLFFLFPATQKGLSRNRWGFCFCRVTASLSLFLEAWDNPPTHTHSLKKIILLIRKPGRYLSHLF